jgi:hypothetical protein
VALTWVGGSKATRVEERSLTLEALRPLMDAFTCVSAQYFHTNEMIEPERIQHGLPVVNRASTGICTAEQAALLDAVDYVVTVQQTAVHVAGAVGAKTFVLLPENPHWRYGVEGEEMPWYGSVTLLRKKTDWESLVQEAIRRIRADLGRVSSAQQKAA